MNGLKECISNHLGNTQVVIYLKETGKSFLLDRKIDVSKDNLNFFAKRTGLRNYMFWDTLLVKN